MASMNEIAGLLKEIEKDLSACARCGMCQAVCPLFKETGLEGDVARGKLALLDGLLENLFDDPKASMDRLNRCLLCGSCAANCPNGVKVVDIFLKARSVLSSVTGLSFFTKQFLKHLLAHPDALNRALNWGRKLQKWAIKPESKVHDTFSSRFTSPLLSKKRHFVPLAPAAFQHENPPVDKAKPFQETKVLFFTGCLIDNIFPRIAEAAMAVFQHHGIHAIIPENQGCCGIPALSAGDADTMTQLIDHHLNIFKGQDFDFLVTACATCTFTIKKIWPMMVQYLPDEIANRAQNLSQKTRDINQFLVNDIGSNFPFQQQTASDPIKRVTYHDPCHLKKSLGVVTEPRSLIRANAGYRFVEMEKADQCCGMGGSFNIDHYDLSQKIGDRKLGHITQTQCHVLATGCPACMIQFSDMLSKAGENITVKHPIEIYAECLP